MCGFVLTVDGPPSSHRMLGRLTRRGPDGVGFYSDGRVTIAHARLEIVGAQDQPEGGPSVLAFNGEIYGQRRDAVFLQAALLNGVDPRHLSGFWAYAHYRNGKIELGRDQFGVKPLYFARRSRLLAGPTFVAGSTLRSVVDQLPTRPSLNFRALSEWARYQLVFGDHTFFEGVFRVMPGEVVTYDVELGTVERRVYEDVWRSEGRAPDEGWFAEARELLRDAVAASTVADVPFASTCSGGLDSSVVTRLAEPEHAFHANFSDPECNETYYAQEVVRNTGTRLLVSNAREDFDLCERLAEIVEDFDDPAIGSVILPLDDLMGAVHRRGYKVLLLGTGGDELFGGYVRYDVMRGVCSQDSYRALFERASLRSEPIQRYELLCAKGRTEAFKFYEEKVALGGFGDAWELAGGDPIAFDRRSFLPGLLGIDDRLSGRWGIEGRPPLLHQPFVRHVAALDSSKLIEGGLKSVAKKLFAPYLPRSVVERTDKMGFSTPIGTFVSAQVGAIKERLEASRFRELFDLSKVRWTTEDKWSREVFGVALLNAWLEEHA